MISSAQNALSSSSACSIVAAMKLRPWQ